MLALVTLCCVFVVCTRASGGDGFETTKAITSVPYGTGQIAVWREEINGRCYMAPISMLLSGSTKVVNNVFTGKVMLQFSLLLWSSETREIVKNHLKTKLNLTISEENIELIPIEKFRFAWNDRAQPPLNHYRLINNWRPYTNQRSTINFHVYCKDAAKCTALNTAIQTDPEMFYALEFQYLTSPVIVREMAVTGAHLARSSLYYEMLGMSLQSGVRYVTSGVVDALAAQTIAVALSSSFNDSLDSVSAGDETALTNALSGVLKTQETSTGALPPTGWPSVYWHPRFSRPDKIATYMNYVLKKDPNDTLQFSVDEARVSDSEDNGGCAVDLGLTGNHMNLTRGNSSVYKIPRQRVLEAVRGKHVEWDGEKFQASPVTVFRLNLSVLNSSSGLVKGKIRVRQYGAVQRAEVQIGNATHAKQLSPELVQSRLNSQIRSLESKVETDMEQARLAVSGLEKKFTTTTASLLKMNQTTINLDEKLDRATAGLERTLARTSRELQTAMVTDAVMNTTLNETLRKMGSVFNDWPAYCRLSNNYCNMDYYDYYSSPRTAAECMKVCDADAQCRGFDFRTDLSNRCYLLDSVCPRNYIGSKSTSDSYIKLAHVPIVTADMWQTVFSNMSLVNIPTDPCHLVGEYKTYSRV